ncbi:MAG: carbon-nitrogen hydrolase [Candidatus Eisenbacteria bacterium]|nr:carbon-nitrogen hydrolase [Candidatus Eisenbacteria bacterium]
MRIGYVQMEPRVGESEANRERVRTAVLAAPEADLLVLPELANSGYHFESQGQSAQLAEPVDGPFVALLRELARARNLTLVSGLAERDGSTLYNSAVLVRPDGSIELYRKLHLFLNEKDHFAPGNLGLPVFQVGAARIGLLICFDWQFPEAWRTLALRGADIVCHPSNLVLPGLAQRAIPVHALLNRLYVVTANRIGTESGLTFTGRSILVGPRGELLAEAPETSEETRVVEIDPFLARDKSVTPRNDLLDDRRPEHYDCGRES